MATNGTENAFGSSMKYKLQFSTNIIIIHSSLIHCCKMTVNHCDCWLLHLPLVARNASVSPERLDAVRKLAASLQCPLLFAEDQVCLISTHSN